MKSNEGKLNAKLKQLEGKEVYLTRTNSSPYKKATIKKVSRVYVYVLFDGYISDKKFRISENDTMHLDAGCNSGWEVYPDKISIDTRNEVIDLSWKLFDSFRFSSDWQKLNLHTLQKVADILGVK